MSASTFSYAQAARGRAVSQSSPQQTSSPAPSTTDSQAKDDASTGATDITAPSVASNSAEVRIAEQTIQPQAEGVSSKQDSEASPVADSASPAAAPTEQSGKAPQEGSAKSADTPNSSIEDKESRSTSRTSRFNDSVDGRKGRKGKKSRASDKDSQSEQNQDEDAEKVKEAAKPVILTEAPPPAVNPWAKRMEAHKVVPKPTAATSPDGSIVGNESKQGSSREDADAHDAVPNGVNGDKKKPIEASQAPRRSGPRGSRASDKGEKSSSSFPLAADSSSWPDPRTAAVREQPTRKTQEKIDTAEKDSQDEAGSNRKKTWEKLEIVHSVVFETQLPPLRGSKPRGGARGGREAGSMRGSSAANAAPTLAASASSDKAAPVGGSTGPKTAATRPQDGSIPTRSASQPQPAHPSKRGSIDGATREQRKPSVPGSTTEQARDQGLDSSFTSKRSSSTRDIRTENGPLGSEAGQASARALLQERSNFQTRGDYTKEGGQQYPARDGRPERGRGGFRARGGHSGPSHIASSSYASNGHYAAPGGFPSRQNPSAHSPPPFSGQFLPSFGHPSRGRGNKWAGSGQSTGRNNPGVTGFPPKAAQMNDFAVPQYPPYMYSPVFDPSIPILRTQIEYYLSVENLCKDYYLRQHMDGQGFAHFSTIANFKRIKAITEDLELLRLACSLSDQIEFGVGDDGVERLRPREKWNLFVLPAGERLEAYRNDGPASFTAYARPEAQFSAPFPGQLVHQPYSPATAGGFPGFPEEQMFQSAFVNGAHYDPALNGGAVNGLHGHDSQLSAGVPEYAPPQSPVTLESMTNFSDSKVENLVVILSYEDKDEAGPSGASGMAGYASESPEQNGVAPQSVNGETADAKAVKQTNHSDHGIVWVDGHGAASTGEQCDRKPYAEIRKAALEQRQNAKSVETPKEMQKLYKFWSQMLLNDFNAAVYQEFKGLAFEDAMRETSLRCGLKNLLEFYDRLFLDTNSQKPWPQDRAVPEIFTTHFNEAVELDRTLGGKESATI